VAENLSGLRVIDVSNPAAPVELGSFITPGFATGVEVVGGLAYVASGTYGLWVIDVSNPAAPVEIGFLDTPGSATDVAVVGGLAYVADSHFGLRVIDVSNPAAPVEIGALGKPEGLSADSVFGLLSLILLGLVAFGALTAIVHAGLTNLLYRQAALGSFRFRSDLRVGPLLWIYLTSGLAVAATVGLALPWARVRMARYRAEHLKVVGYADLDAFVETSEQDGSRLGELASEVADAFDFDFGL
jgi:hypothetical protein